MPTTRTLKYIKLSQAIALIAILPSIAAIFFATQLILSEAERSTKASKVSDITELSLKLNDLVHELQKERGASAVFLSGKGQNFHAELNKQRKNTNASRSTLLNYLQTISVSNFGSEFSQKTKHAIADLGQIEIVRSHIDQQELSSNEAIEYYSLVNSKIISAISFMSEVAPDVHLANRLFAYGSFLYAKENAGIERAVGSAQITIGQFTPKELQRLITLANTQQNYFSIFQSHASHTEIQLFDQIMMREESLEVQRIRDIIYRDGLTGDLEGIEGVYWFDTMTKKINGLKELEEQLTENLQLQANSILTTSAQRKAQGILIALVFLTITVFISILIITLVNGSFNAMLNSTVRLAKGELDIELPKNTNNEIGEIFQALEVFRRNGLEQQELKVALQKHKDNLEQEVKMQTQDLQELNEELEEFTYRTSHDLRSPLVSALRLMQLAEKSINSQNQEKALKTIKLAEESLSKLEQLTVDISTIAKSKKLLEDDTQVDPVEIVEGTLTKLSHIEGFSDIDINFRFDHATPITTKESRFVMVVENMVSNAIKYRDQTKEKSYINIRSYTANNHFVFEVHDNGLGIPQNQQKNLFSMFKRFHPKVSFGSGLGLYLMKKSADILRGRIEFSDPGDGSIFRLWIPYS